MAIYQDGIEEFTQIANFVLRCTDAARCLRPPLSSVSLLVAFGIGTRLAAERDTHAALRVSRDQRSGVAMGLWFQRHGARILRPLLWFELLESRSEGRSATELIDPYLYRKAPLFDRFV